MSPMRAQAFGAGMLRHRVSIQRLSPTGDGQGGTASTYTPIATVWAKIEPLQGGELFAAQQVSAHTSHKITLRYFDGMTAADRIVFGDRTFNIREVINVLERNRWHELIAEEFAQ